MQTNLIYFIRKSIKKESIAYPEEQTEFVEMTPKKRSQGFSSKAKGVKIAGGLAGLGALLICNDYK